MKTLTIITATASVLLASAFTMYQSVNYKVKDDAYAITFKGGRVEGTFKGLKASILFNESSPETSKIVATIDATSIETGNSLRDKHAKSENGLNANVFSLIGFESTSVSGKSGVYEAQGKLTLKGTTKIVKLPFTFEHKGSESLFKGKLTIVPNDYNITKAGTPDVVEIDLTIPVTK
jgi:polyisoprenoid-binding protein YceI